MIKKRMGNKVHKKNKLLQWLQNYCLYFQNFLLKAIMLPPAAERKRLRVSREGKEERVRISHLILNC